MARKKSSSGGFGKFVLGLVAGGVLAAAGTVAYFRYVARPAPRAAASKPLLIEKGAAPPVSAAPVEHAVKKAPFGISEDVFEAGAHVYKRECASCHGTPGHDAAPAKHMGTAALQLWKKRANSDVVGVSGEPVGETYWKVANGIRQSGMPGYQHVLSETQMWQVSLLLKNADQQMPDPVMAILGSESKR